MSKSDPTGPVIVVVDDDHRQVRRIQGALEDAGFRTRLFTSADSAMRHITATPPAVVITGAETFGLTTLELLAKSSEALAERMPPFVLLGASDDPRFTAKIAAPADMGELVSLIQSLTASLTAPVVAPPAPTPAAPTTQPPAAPRPWEIPTRLANTNRNT